MNEKEILIGLLAGLLPYKVVSVKTMYGCRVLRLQAIFWDATVVKGCCGAVAWQVNVPLIQKLRGMANAVLTQLRDINQR